MLGKATVIAALIVAVSAQATAPQYGQCAGIGYVGATACPSGWSCKYSNDYYSQCLPGAASSSAAPQPPATPAPPPVTPNPPAPTSPGANPPPPPSPSPPTSAGCTTAATISGYNNAQLPNPFLLNNGQTVATKADWDCRRQQIQALVSGYEAGDMPPKPTTLTATFSATSISITAGQNGKTINWSNAIKYPTGTPPQGGWPLVIGYDSFSLPVPSNIATLTYPNSNMAVQNDASTSRGTGLFYNLYGNTHTASAMVAWAWGVSRIIDVIESNPTAAKIDPTKIAVTGCSRNGKGALMAGAFEPRVALTIPQESGSGGDACWRLSKFEESSGVKVQTATEIVTENVWFSKNFPNYVNNLNTLPFDHHSLIAMVAPRGLISFENTDYIWLSPLSAWGCVSAAHTVYTALGVPQNHGFAQVGGHAHCAWPTSLTPTLNAFFNKFLLGNTSISTNFFSTNNVFNGLTWNAANWTNWATPTLQ